MNSDSEQMHLSGVAPAEDKYLHNLHVTIDVRTTDV